MKNYAGTIKEKETKGWFRVSERKLYTLEEVKDYWRNRSFVIYNDRDFLNWLESQSIFKEVI